VRLYHSPMSISLACRLALSAANADYNLAIVNALAGETRQEPFLSVNPLGQIPVLECDGAILTQTVAILSFIAERTGRGWEHATACDRAKALSIMVLASVDVQGAWSMHDHPERFADSEAGRSEVVAHALTRLDNAYREVEHQLGQLEVATELGIVDYYLCVFALWKAMVPAASGFAPTPRLDAVKERVMSSPKLRQVIEEDIAAFKAAVS
jgi:glutathione S-transferase